MSLLRRPLALSLAVGLALSAWSAPHADLLPEFDRDSGVEITADRIQFFVERDLYVAEGHVHIVQEEKSLRAEWATFSTATRLGVASGDVDFAGGAQKIDAEFVQFDVDSLEGVIFGGDLDLGTRNLRIAAEEFVRHGEDRYEIFDARFTTCRCPDPDDTSPWEIHAEHSDVEVGGYGTSRNATFEVLGVPAIWFPWIMYPVKTERQTGLLVPDVGIGGRNGFSFALPFFWAARPDTNVIYAPGWLQKRGFTQSLEVQTLYGETSKTELLASFTWDEKPPPSGERPAPGQPQPTVGQARGAVALAHDQELPKDARFKISGIWTSDNEYLFDFNDFPELRRNRFLESVAFAYRNGADVGRFGAGLSSWYAEDVQSTTYNDRDPFLLQRLVDVDVSWLDGPLAGLPWLGLAVDTDYEYFGRRAGVLDTFAERGYVDMPNIVGDRFADTGISATPNDLPGDPATRGDGLFEEGEPLYDEGHRFTIHPRLSFPMRLNDAVEWNTEIGWKQTLYASRQKHFRERGLATALSNLQVEMVRTFGKGTPLEVEHRMVPRVSWAFVSRAGGQEKNPLFVPRTAVTQFRVRQRALENVILDNADIIPETNQVVFAWDHRFYQGTGLNKLLLGEFGIGFSYDFASNERGGRLIAEGRHLKFGPSSSRFQIVFDTRRAKIDELAAVTSISWPWEIQTSFGYRFVPDGPDFYESYTTARFRRYTSRFDEINQLSGAVSFPLGKRLRAAYAANYTFSGEFFLTNAATLDYVSPCGCWSAGVRLSASRDDQLRVQFRYTVVGLGDNMGSGPGGRAWYGFD